MNEWITVAQAAALVGRHKRNVWRWIEQGKLRARTNADGVMEVRTEDALRIESVTKRGRPRGVPNRRTA